jgi:YD repeat-containing protein
MLGFLAHLSPSVPFGGGAYLKIVDRDGRGVYFTDAGGGVFEGALSEPTAVTYAAGVYTWTRQDGQRYLFDDGGRLARIEDPAGNAIELSYDAEGRLSTAADLSTGRTLSFSYDADGRIATVTDVNGPDPGDDRVTSYIYDASGEYLERVTTPDGRDTDYAYQTTGDVATLHALISAQFPDTRSVHCDSDDSGRVVETHGNGGINSITYHYDAVGVVRVQDAEGLQTVLRRGLDGHWSQVANPGAQSTLRMRYDEFGSPVEVGFHAGEELLKVMNRIFIGVCGRYGSSHKCSFSKV